MPRRCRPRAPLIASSLSPWLPSNLEKRRLPDGPRELAQGSLPGVMGPPRVETLCKPARPRAVQRPAELAQGASSGETPLTSSRPSVHISAFCQCRIPRLRELGNTVVSRPIAAGHSAETSEVGVASKGVELDSLDSIYPTPCVQWALSLAGGDSQP